MAAVDDIRSRLDLNQIAGMLGTDVGTADAAVQQALSQLVGTMGGRASDPEAAAGLTRAALNDHLTSPAYGDRIDITQVDTEDGAKIVDHVMPAAQRQSLGGTGDLGGLMQKLLPILAPIVMSYLADKMSGRLPGQAGGQSPQAGAGGGLGDLLGGLLGGSGAQGQQLPSGGVGGLLKDILLGGGR